jgi:hypothetical protein
MVLRHSVFVYDFAVAVLRGESLINNDVMRIKPTSLSNTGFILVSPLRLKLVQIIFKNSVRTSKRTPHFTITKINWLMLFKEIIAVYNY